MRAVEGRRGCLGRALSRHGCGPEFVSQCCTKGH